MELPRDGDEYAHITFTGLPDGATVEASTDRTTWYPTTIGDTDQERLVLLAGPDATAPNGSVTVTEEGQLWVRVTDTPEVIVRSAGPIYLT